LNDRWTDIVIHGIRATTEFLKRHDLGDTVFDFMAANRAGILAAVIAKECWAKQDPEYFTLERFESCFNNWEKAEKLLGNNLSKSEANK
jgi:hypothetical protein